ncbi:FAD-dependent oxidoreductase [Lichenihabitans sp. Uapishka_5]|uniref:GcvT family protein n=1 Tax=Lichenihabitans sp. Uapishka_5 TaxID=3037302 RepID=UPI0029E7F853|nr:FAD-dependent oxidoreductase [Lichenihabitans sp. Uapishka_5]MDX7953352.1 FAD-dependent oxidoreductase [Lichenihabitans sp. Uapishka_5]
MKSQAQVVVIGGGVVGASVLYHLTKAGWRDVMLLERAELTAGSTWHAAGGMHTINGDPTIAKLQQYTIELYKEIEAISGQSCGVHLTGGLMLAGTRERMDWLKMVKARGRYLGMDLDLLSADEAERLFPLMDKSHFVGGLYDPIEGHVDPYGVTHAYARAAQIGGATIERQCRVTGLEQYPDGSWLVRTEKGDIQAEHVVNCGGLWAREVGRMVGIELPVLAMEHHYIITEDIPALAGQPEQLHCVDFEGEIYTRQERGGMLLGTYEKNCVPWSERETPWDFGQNLLPDDLERIAPELEVGFAHFPVFNTVGIKKVVNGPFTFAPDGNPLLGPVRGLKNFWVACGVMAGFSQGGGVGLALANWITRGDPGFDIWGMDVARYGDWTTLAYTQVKVRENYSRRFRIRYPNEELPAGRPYRTSPIYDRLAANHAVWGEYCGLEHALWFAPSAALAREDFTFKRPDTHDIVAAEVKAVREGVGLIETTNYGKFEVTGPNAEAFLNRVMANRMPPIGRMVLTPMLNEAGKLIGDFTVGRWAADKFLVVGTYAAETYYERWFDRFLPETGCTVRACAMEYAGLALAGPKSRALLQTLVHQDLSTAAFPFMSFARMDVGTVPALVGRVSFTGELGYEVWVKADFQRTLYDMLVVAGEPHGLKLFGGRALHTMRVEKGFGTWAREFRPSYGPDEAGLGRFVALNKGDFIGRDAVASARADGGGPMRLVTLAVEATDADALGDEPIWHDGAVVGWVTSGGYGHAVGRSLALGYVPKALATRDDGFAVEIDGALRPATRIEGAPYDAAGQRMRG